MDIDRIDLNLLRIFASVYRKRSATLAGEDLGLTQSAVSNGLKRLRAHFGDPLFVKTAQGMMPSPMAERLAAPLQEALDAISHAVRSSEHFDPATSRRRFRIYVGDMGQLVLMPRLMALLQQQAPGISIAVVDATPREAQTMMSEGTLDIAIGGLSMFGGNFHSQRLFSKHYVVIARKGHPALHGGLTMERFLAARHAVFRPAGGGQDDFEAFVNSLFLANEAPRRVVVELAHGLGVVETVSTNDLLCCVPSRLASRDTSSQIEVAPLPFEYPSSDIQQFWHHRFHGDVGHQWLRTAVFRNYHAPADEAVSDPAHEPSRGLG